jgi:hypothetical protein
MIKSIISYDPAKNEKAGFLVLSQHESKPLQPSDKKRLLHLLFWLTFTEEGRKFVGDNRESKGLPEDQIRAALLAKFNVDFGIIDAGLQVALINAHLAADRWVVANANMPDASAAAARQLQESVYQQNMSFVMWALWEDAMGHEFSMNW